MKTLSDDYPVLFVSHGPPLVGVNDCPAHHFFKQLGREIAKPDAVLVISAWKSNLKFSSALNMAVVKLRIRIRLESEPYR